ncbi:MAG: UDP-N-acetylmuramoyl-L-alanine--D-glutamate ligase [Candidatus Tokpelaia sp.]|nr:MAG: UDP-N-acetylmuramoyl-L-alanine--D-glutamate ligase [Candidatus Tokpelaia sp.]KAA6206696.1 MAG: UDP-N-acetylmuramoyl-L-alanine--D-glutamate ligase [Candidatus Tokpelaia sp.]
MQAGRALQAGRPACGGKAPAKNPAGGGLQQEKETQAGLDGSACGGRLQQEKNIKDFCPFIAITGTNGKSTTTALLAHILRRAGYNVQMGGNIGRPVLELAPFALSAKQVYVVEISSYQIDLTPSLNPTIGVVLNITPDHIDRHGSFRAYAALKERLAVQSGTAIIAYDDAPCQAIYDRLKQADKNPVRIVTSSDNARAEKLLAVLIEQGSEAEGFFAFGSWLNYKPKGKAPVNLLYDLDKIVSLRGQHNAQNALAAIVACGILHVPSGMVEKALQSFPGLPHRMESVGKLSVPWGEIEFVNDSKATNAEAALPALRSFENIYWIAGGIAKQGGIESLMEYVPRVQKAYLIGEAAAEFAKTLELSKEGIGIMGMGRMERMMDKTRRPYVISGTLAKAVKQAVADAKRDLKKGYIWSRRAVILLAPACASFDQFKNFEERGKAFAALAKQYSGGGRSK